jgi:hypothetical protein
MCRWLVMSSGSAKAAALRARSGLFFGAEVKSLIPNMAVQSWEKLTKFRLGDCYGLG